MALQPKYFWSGEAGKDQIPGFADGCFRASEFSRDQIALGRRAGITPQLRRAYHLAFAIQSNKSVLLS